MKNKLNELETLLNKKCNDECSNCNYKRECEEYTKLSYKKKKMMLNIHVEIVNILKFVETQIEHKNAMEEN